jgi:hypothetical protein
MGSKVRLLRLVEEPPWLQSATLEASDRVQITREGIEVHVRFADGHPAAQRGFRHVVFGRLDFLVMADEEKAPARK